VTLATGRAVGRDGPSAGQPQRVACRFCSTPLGDPLVDLGASPLANSYLTEADLLRPEVHYPLALYVCPSCLLVQLPEYEAPEEIFTDYAYFSSYSESWVEHARRYVAAVIPRFGLGPDSHVVELASNDGYLLKHLIRAGVPVLGVEPAENVAAAAQAAGVPTEVAFFGEETARRLLREGHAADLMVANNVLAHVPDLNDFVAGFAVLLKDEGVATFEFPDLARLIAKNEFDTIYHEHFTYFSLLTADNVMRAHGLRVFDVQELPTHGGSLRIYVCHADSARHRETATMARLREREPVFQLGELATYRRFQERVHRVKTELLGFLVDARRARRTVVGYGAPAKGNTLLNFCGVRADLIEYTVDRNPAKQGSFLPGSRIPIHTPARIPATRPDYVLILPWNLAAEITEQMAEVRGWGGRFVTPIPELRVHG
jgi:SAM-dependent methyltransferase